MHLRVIFKKETWPLHEAEYDHHDVMLPARGDRVYLQHVDYQTYEVVRVTHNWFADDNLEVEIEIKER